MGIGLFILLPESTEIAEKYFADLKKTNGDKLIYNLPYSFFFCFFSYAFLLLVEKIFFNTSMIIPIDLNEDQGISGFDNKESNDEEEETIKNIVSAKGKFASFLQIRNSKIYYI